MTGRLLRRLIYGAAWLALWTPPQSPPAFAMPPGYFIDSTLAAGPLPSRWEELDGEFTVSIRRGYPDSSAARLLRIAEAVCPPGDLLVRIALERSYDFGDDTVGVSPWWQKGTGEGRVPYAVTAAAVEYYLRLTELYRERKFREAGTRPLYWSELIYRSTIAERDTFALAGRAYAGVYVAHQSLFWSFDDGTFVPRVDARRVVVLTPDGGVLAVDGDGAARETATLSTHRGIGRKEELLR